MDQLRHPALTIAYGVRGYTVIVGDHNPFLQDIYGLSVLTVNEPIKLGSESGWTASTVPIVRYDDNLLFEMDQLHHPALTIAYGVRGYTGIFVTKHRQNYAQTTLFPADKWDSICRKEWEYFSDLALCAGKESMGDQIQEGDTGGSLAVYPYDVYPTRAPQSPILVGMAVFRPATNSGYYIRVSRYCDGLHTYTQGQFQCNDYAQLSQ
uniref:Peptidase S1 domain-containing protein n=1 Tax=Steinernema glaseri TaxID=37863 RepID=A0A1I7ZY10_9BILA